MILNESTIEDLARYGMVPMTEVPLIQRALQKIVADQPLLPMERKAFYTFFKLFYSYVVRDSTSLRLLKQNILRMNPTPSLMKEETEKAEDEFGHRDPEKRRARAADDMAKRKAARDAKLADAKKELDDSTSDVKSQKKAKRSLYAKTEGIDFKKAPEAMLNTYANLVKTKERHKASAISDTDKDTVRKAKDELRRRKKTKEVEESTTEFDAKLAELLKEYGVESMDQIPYDQIGEFISKL